MIHKFSVSNYHSIREEVVLDLRIPGTAPDLPCFRRSAVKPDDIRLPTVAVLVGPNGSGKTTLLRALVTAADIVSSVPLTGDNRSKVLVPFLSGSAKGKPTRFCVEFETDRLLPDENPQLFRYDFLIDSWNSAAGTSDTFRHEALLHFPKGRPRRLIERGEPGTPIYVSSDFGLRPSDDRLKAVRADASAISTLALFNVPLAMRIVAGLRVLLTSTNIVAHDTWSFSTKDVIEMFENHPVLRDWIKSQIQCSDLGIRDVRIADGGTGEKLVWFDHDGLDTPILLDFESSGTKSLFHLLPKLGFALNTAGLALLDEIDGDLHVDIANEILRWFRSRESNPDNAQLLVTSHNVGLLDDLEKEEVFIVEKDDSGATRVHGAQDVRGLRRDARLYPKYRAGMLGGIPRLG